MAPATVYQLDANVLLRFLRNDHRTYSSRAAAFIQAANAGKYSLEVSAVVVGEVFYTLKSVYQVDRKTAAALLSGVLATPGFHMIEAAVIQDALLRIQKANVDFGDAYLAAVAAESKTQVASFDRDFDKFSDIKRHEP